ncbi:lysosome-associated membrane glycoprotein 5 [Drosophila willistoni]|uniref:lysosome-associated membrane glycoprotein 5 n=1 Tax=Drosophila willistoni TaxID=7260 RepID=UPI000C26D0D3|nr:lysosome-associated membrane glycoprotein 5 [Drosophila willistoni]
MKMLKLSNRIDANRKKTSFASILNNPFSLNVSGLIAVILALLMVSATQGLQLSAFTTKTPRVTKFTTKGPSASSMNHEATTSIYRFNATNGITCILMQVDGLIGIKYRNKLGEDVEADLYMPDTPQLSGECVESNMEILTMDFRGFRLSMTFKKSSGGEGWYINLFELTYSSSNSLFEHPDRPGLNVKLTSPVHQPMFFPTPVGKSYVCDKEKTVIMYAPQDSGDQSGHIARLYLRDLHMQSFMFKESGKWGPSFHCSATGSYRDETAPLAVGTALAIAVLLTISGYGGWRYFKIKKVQYGSME